MACKPDEEGVPAGIGDVEEGSEANGPEQPVVPRPTPQFRRRAWVAFQRALDPLSAPRPMRPPRV